MKARSISGSTKLPVSVFTGSSAYPEVIWPPCTVAGSISICVREIVTPAASKDAWIAASETVEMSSPPPTASKASATVFAHVTSLTLLVRYVS